METKKTAFSMTFWVRKNKSKGLEVPIYARVTFDGKRMEQSTNQKIVPEDWNGKKGMAKLVKEEYKALNNHLEQLRASFVECYRQMSLAKKTIDIESFKRAYYGIEEDEFTLCKLVNYHNQDMKDTVSWGTLKNYFTTQKYLQKYLKDRLHVSDIGLKELNYKFVNGFGYFLKSFKPVDYQKPLGNNGVMKHMERFRKMVNVALKNEWMEKDPFKAYKPKFKKFERGFLTQEELETIEQKDFEIERIQFVKDLFIFSCYTGLAYTDAVSLTPANLMRGIDGDYWLFTLRQKTDTSVKIPLLPKAMEMIEKYK